MSKNIRVKSVMPKNASKEDIKKVKEQIDALSAVAQNIAPEGTLLVSVYDKRSTFAPAVKVAKDLMDLEFIYNFQSIQKNPALLEEYNEIVESIKTIERVVGKRKKKRNESFQKRKEESKEEK